MEKKNIDWENIGFGYIQTDKRFVANYKNGAWDEGTLTDDANIVLNECAGVLQYAQTCFEGMKAYTTEDGHIVTFRPDLNAKRMEDSARRLEMPVFPQDKFVEAIVKTVEANEAYVPPYGTGGTLYIRPFVIGVGDNIGVKPAPEYIFSIFCVPVGAYFKDGLTPCNFTVADYDRAAPHGTGGQKVGGNYAASMQPHKIAADRGFADCIYLDPATRTNIEEVGAANFFGITKNNEFVTPLSPSVLPSITKYSLMEISEKYLHMPIYEREIPIDYLDQFKEAGACGTAAVITPIGGIEYKGKLHVFYSETEVGPITKELYRILCGIQFGDVEAPEGWIYTVE